MATHIKKDFASPNGPILLLSAKGSTTASIAEANGVKDFSGNGNHGQAFGGVTVVNDVDLGECFSFDGQTNMYLLVKHTLFQSASSFTVTFEMKGPSDQTNVWLITASNGSTTGAFFRFGGSDRVLATLNYAGEFGQGDTGKCFSGPEGSVIYDNKPHFVTYTIDIQQKIAYMTVDGSMTGQESFDSVGNANFACTDYVIGKAWTSYTGRANYKGLLNNFRIYSRALSLNEIKYLYNGFQPNLIMGQTIPSGAILDLSARGLTTAGIAQANGVVDRSGNGNHGQAYNGVAIVNDDEMGRCLSNDETGYILFPTSMLSGLTVKQLTMCALIKLNQITSTNGQLIWEVQASNYGCLGQIAIEPSGHFRVAGRSSINDSFAKKDSIALAEVNKLYFITGIVNYETKQFTLYINGQIVATDDGELVSSGSLPAYVEIHAMGRSRSGSTLGLNGYCTDIHVYTRALTASEVQQLADASLKKIRGVSMGSNLIKHIYYGSNLIYVKSASYEYETEDADNIKHIQNNTDLWGIEKLRGTNGDYIVACGIDKIIKVYKGTSGNLKFSTSMVNSSALKYDICQGKTDDIIYLAEHLASSSNSYLRKLRYTGNGFEEVANIASGSGHGLDYDFANDLIIAADYYGGKIRIFRDDGDTLSAVSSIGAGRTYVSDVGVTSDGRYVYYTGYNNNYLGRYDTVTGTVNSSFKQLVTSGSGWQIMGFALSDDNKKIVFSHAAQSSIKVYDLEKDMIIYTLSNGDDTICTRIRNLGNNKFIYVTLGSSVRKLVELDLSAVCSIPVEVGFKLHQLNSTSQRNTIEYVGSNSDYASITYSNGTVNMGDWSDWINAHFTPVMLKSNGTVDYELNRDNLNYKSDGSTPSDIANTSYDGNAMLQIKKFYISVTSTTEDSHEVFNVNISDTKKDSSYTCYGFVDKDGNEQAFAYYSLFHCYIDSNNKLRSKAGITLSSYTTQSNYATMLAAARNNGSGWDISNYALENAIGLVLMMIYKDVNPMFVHQDSSNNYRESSTTPYNTTGALAASGGFPWTTTSTMPKALWLESYWRNAAIPGLASNTWVNGLGSLKNSNNIKGFGIYYKLTPPYTMSDPSLWTYMSNTVPYVYTSNSHQLEDVTVYENLLFPKSDAPDAIGPGTGLAAEHYTRYWGGGDVNSLGSSYHSATELRPIKTGLYRAMDKWAAPPHYLSYHAFGRASYQSHLQVGAGRLIYLKNSN